MMKDMIRFANDNHFIYLQGVPASDKSMMEVYFNAVWSKPKQHWRLPLNRHVMTELWRSFPDLRNSEKFKDLGIKAASKVREALDRRKPDALNLNSPLRRYQLEDVHTLETLPSAGIFNEPRTGKTPTAITLMKRIGKYRNLVVCPASLTLNWKKEIEQWWPEAEAYPVSGSTSRKRMKAYDEFAQFARRPKVLVISKDTMKGDFVTHAIFANEKFDTCFVDEAHFLRNYGTNQSKAVFKIKADRRYAMTGTPTVNHPSDIWGILHFLDPVAYPSFWQFTARYFDTFPSEYSQGLEYGEPKDHRKEELKELVGLVSVQRKRSEVMAWLPKKQYSKLPAKMEGKQLKLYNDMKEFFVAVDEDSGKELDTSGIMAQLMRMRQLCLDPRLVGFDVPGAKTKVLTDYLQNRREPIVIMSMFTSYLKMIAPDIEKIGRKVGFVHGEMSSTEKQSTVDAFQAGRIDVLFGNIIACGVGHTLDRSNTVMFLDRAWTPAENDQAEDRVCPTSETKNHAHLIIDLECEGSIDSRINAVLKTKRTLIDFINQGGRNAIKSLLGG